jgi:hypothetical protein
MDKNSVRILLYNYTVFHIIELMVYKSLSHILLIIFNVNLNDSDEFLIIRVHHLAIL